LPNPAIKIIDATSLATRSTYPSTAVDGLAWSPNGKWIAASSGQAVVRIDVATGAELQIVGPSGHLDSPKHVSWSPDSLHIAFVQYVDQFSASDKECFDSELCQVDVFVADANGGHPTRVNALAGHADLPSWSPDGQWLAFREVNWTRLGAGQGPIDVQVAHPDGTAERTVIRSDVVGYSWGAGSDQLVYAVSAGQVQATLWITALNGNAQPLGISIDQGQPPIDGTIASFAWQPVTSH
jgi:Tol biopolymer transport system component